MKINEAVIKKSSVDGKIRDIFEDSKKFRDLFTIYLKLHTKQKHIKSMSNGRLITEETYLRVVKNG